MDRQQLEKLFDEKFDFLDNKSVDELKQFIFDTVIPEVLKDIQKEFGHFHNVNDCLDVDLKKRAKERYGITI